MHVNDGAGNICYCSPHHKIPLDSRNQGSKCMSMMRRAISARPYLPDDPDANDMV